jgi:hypothetical protein
VKLLPTQYKAALLAAALVGSAGAGWLANGWRQGKKLEAQKAQYWEAKARRGQSYSDTLAQAATAASGRITEAQAILKRARAQAQALVAEAAQNAPKGPEYQCREKPLPETYLETFRK